MRNTAKRALSLFLCLVMLFSCASAALAAVEPMENVSQIPIILIGGDGTALQDENGNEIFRFINFTSRDTDSEELKESVLNVVKPLLVQGLLTNNFEPYYEALYNEIAELASDVLLDENGNPRNGTGISPGYRERMENNLHNDYASWQGYYGLHNYEFWYDWRLDPLATADDLAAYIEGIKAVTHHDKVILVSHCVGGAVALAYIAKYGTDSIYGVGMDGVTSFGSEPLSQSISGKFKLDGASVNRLLYDLQALDFIDLDPFVNETVDLAVRSGLFDTAKTSFKIMLYYRIVQGVTSALALSTFYTCPMYWTAVRAEDYEDALYYVFGPEGSEKRQQYAGLIEKIQAYHDQVTVKIPELMQSVKDAGGNVCIIAKYGWQMVPTGEGCDVVGDQIISVNYASLGATGSKVYGTLDDAYIAQRVKEGKGRYISPDLQIDASTCLFPDCTWFVKGPRHSHWTKLEDAILCTALSGDGQRTVEDLSCTQFVVVDNDTEEWAPMTAENCNTYHWDAETDPSAKLSFIDRVKAYFKSLRTWLNSLRRILREYFNKQQSQEPETATGN